MRTNDMHGLPHDAVRRRVVERREYAGGAFMLNSGAREVARPELNGMIGSIAHLAYHLGAIRQIAAAARGPREGTHDSP